MDASEEEAKKRELRAKARWFILRRALLSSSSSSSTTSSSISCSQYGNDGDDDPNDNDGTQQQQQQQHTHWQQHSMNTFPGFCVLHRDIVSHHHLPRNGIIDSTVTPKIDNSIGDDDEKDGTDTNNWDTVQYTYKYKSNNTTPSPFDTEVQFLTHERKMHHQRLSRQPTMSSTMKKCDFRNRIEELISHRNHNGVDNTGNVRVWDAEMTLAGFLLDCIMMTSWENNYDDYDRGEDSTVRDRSIEDHGTNNAVRLLHLRNQLRRRMLLSSTSNTTIQDFASAKLLDNPSTSIVDKEDEEALCCNILELGAGQAGLAGLALMAASCITSDLHTKDNMTRWKMKPCHVILTDGHPKCVQNNKICVDMSRKMMASQKQNAATSVGSNNLNGTKTKSLNMKDEEGISTIRAGCKLLVWDSSPIGAIACRQVNSLVVQNDRQYQSRMDTIAQGRTSDEASAPLEQANSVDDEGVYNICLASDCLHFQEFHDGLLTTIARTLVVGGMALLCQPKRGTSLNNFIELIDAVNKNVIRSSNDAVVHEEDKKKYPLFEITMYEDFHPKVSAMHRVLVAGCVDDRTNAWLLSTCSSSSATIHRWSKHYDANLHLPLLLVLKKLRRYDESMDGELIRQHVKNRKIL